MQRIWMAAPLAGMILVGSAGITHADPQDDLRAKLEAKKQETWFTANPWTADYDAARRMAAESGKPIFAYFTRSYAP